MTMSDIGLQAFADGFYRQPEAQALLLECQDRWGMDVLCLLGACWLASSGRKLDVDDWRQVLAGQAHWRDEVIEPLRRARRGIKPIVEASELYRQVKQCELSAEWLALEWLEPSLDRHAAVSGESVETTAREAIAAYCEASAVTQEAPPSQVRDALAALAANWRADISAPGA
ncbi:TIGR02444 family protein [Halopseudomonas xinjiangensis]|uniref:TIGR02444 family protein n=1 Tax=Halopseudomonas xinjiangensis TaxID=487184 RepID=A0A1H1YKE9_9GAMM|nr:TIGR02444 family protein [Halopseudomonas xinjiangensis]SDT21864.1 TIGR02444 family protein [Halopseudomonas xinjiangensis]